MSIPAMPAKASDEILDYMIDMTLELAGRLAGPADDTITGVSWTVPADLSTVSTSHTANTVTIWLSGGVLGNKYEVAAEMTTAGGRTYHRSFKISIKDR